MKLFYSFLFLASFFALSSQEKIDKHTGDYNTAIEEKLKKVQLIFDADSIYGFNEQAALQQASFGGSPDWEQKMQVSFAKRKYINYKYNIGNSNKIYSPLPSVQAACSNVDFESGNATGWTITEGINTNSTTHAGCCPTASTRFSVVGPGTDPIIPALSQLPPAGGGNFSLKLGDGATYGGYAVKTRQTFTVTPANSVFIYRFAVVLEDAQHACTDQPYFNVSFTDCSSNPIPCSDYNVVPISTSCSSGDPSFSSVAGTNGFNYFWKNWTTKSFDLTAYIGQCVTIEFIASDCVAQGHAGWAYVDCSCKPMSLSLNGIDIPVGQVNNNLCQTGTNTLCAPPGFDAYDWSGPGVTGQTGQCITPNAIGTYSVSLTMAGISCVSPVLYSSFNFTPAAISNFTYNALPCQNTLSVPFTSTVNLNGGPPVTYSWDFNNDGVVDDNTANPTFNYPAFGTYTAQLQVSNGACLNTLTQVVSIQPTPTVNISSVAPICPATCTELFGQAYQSSSITVTTTPSFTNSTSTPIPDVSTITSSINTTGLTSASLTSVCLNINHTFDADLDITLICPGGISLLLTADNGSLNNNYTNTCFNLTSAQVITAGAAPFSSATGYIPQGGPLSNLNGCTPNGAWQLQVTDDAGGDVGTLLNWTLNFTNVTTSSGTVAASSYTWSPNTSMTGGSSLTPTVCPSVSTIYTLSATNAANGCVTSSTVQVLPAVGAPTIAVTSNSLSLDCNTAIQTVTVSGIPSTDLTYNWNLTPSSLSANNTIASFTNSGNYICTVTNTVSNCVSTIQVSVSNNTAVPTSTATTAGVLTCNNSSVILNSTLAGMNYTWSAPPGGSITTVNSQTTSANGVGDYTLSIIDPTNGCSYITTTAVTQNTVIPVLSAGTNQTITCISPSVTLNGNVTSPINPTINWTGPGLCGATNNINTQACSIGIYTLTATDPINGCVNSSTVQVFSNTTGPIVAVSSNSLVLNCVTSSQTATVTSIPSTSVTYSWSAAPASQSLGGAVASFTTIGTYTCTVTNAITNCSTITQVNVTINNTQPTINITPTQTITCANPTAVITLTTLPTSGLTYTWTSTPISGQGTNSVVVNQANIYSVTVTDASNGCTNTATTQIISNSNIPSASISATSSNSIITCSNPSVTLTASVTPSSSYSYTWLPGGGGSSINATSANTYSVVVLNTVNGCTTLATYNLLSNTIAPNLIANNAIIPCYSSSVNVIATSTNNVSYSWTTTNGTLLSNGTATAQVGSTGIYTVTATDLINGCVSSMVSTVTQTFITGGLTANPISGAAPLLVNFSNQTNGTLNYSWAFGDNNNNTSSSADPTHTYTTTGVYIVTLITTDATGLCSATSTISIEVLENSFVEVPNVFTPNGDGLNDVFSIHTKGISELKCYIYNRWGLKLYTISNPTDYWDGGGYSDGTYFYVLEAKGLDSKEYKQQGFISMFK